MLILSKPGVGQRLVNLQFVSGRYTTKGKPRGFEEFRQTMTPYTSDDTTNIDVIQTWNCKGKFIWMTLDQGKIKSNQVVDEDFHRSIWITLGMSGRFQRDTFLSEKEDDGTLHKQPRWYFEFLDEGEHNEEKKTRKIFYYDIRNFGTLRFSSSKKELVDKLKSLGPDILDDCTEEIFITVMRKQQQKMNVCKFLMNQSKIAGIGNYILSEALFRANLDPFASLDEITDDQAKLLYQEVTDTAQSSYDAQGVTRRAGGSYRDVDGNEGNYAFSLQCYGNEFCPKGRQIIRETNGPHGRTIWYVEDQLFLPRFERENSLESSSIVPKIEKSKGGKIISATESQPVSDEGLSLTDALSDESWKEVLSPFLKSEKFVRLSNFVESERRLHDIYPLSQDVFTALNTCSFDDVKVVIIGQDPYHGPGQGHGLAFSVQKDTKIPPSLKNIFKELESDIGIQHPSHGNLEYWASQGVLLLNTVLTVERGNANSHSRMGWEDFSDEIISALNEKQNGLVFLLWGGPAAKKAKAVDESRHAVIKTSHPSPLGATKTKSPFLVRLPTRFLFSFLRIFDKFVLTISHRSINREATVSVDAMML